MTETGMETTHPMAPIEEGVRPEAPDVVDVPLARNLFLVKEHVTPFKAANNYDIFDPESGEMIMQCREENLGMISKLLRFTDYKTMTPFEIVVRDMEGADVVRVKRGVAFIRSKVDVFGPDGEMIGYFRQKVLSIGGAFRVFDCQDAEVCSLKGRWTGWNFKFIAGERELAQVSKQWGGFGRELFTSADNYFLNIDESVPADSALRRLILGAVMCIDMVLKEK